MGARPLARLVQDELLRPLGDEILFGALENGGTVTVEVRDGALSLVCLAGVDEPAAPSDPGTPDAGTPRPQESAVQP
jgi:ATP-dependent Clp protease ATP-binding subunit ClpA